MKAPTLGPITSLFAVKEAAASCRLDGETQCFPEPVQWFKYGDHAEVRYFRHPNVDGETVCETCGVTYHDHGWIDTGEEGHTVCPGDYIVQDANGEWFPVLASDPFINKGITEPSCVEE